MNSTNCTDNQTLYTLQIILDRGHNYWWGGESVWIPENFHWKVGDANRVIIYGKNQYKTYYSPKNETFCLDTYSCYEIFIQKRYSYGSEAGFTLFAGDELLAEMRANKRDWNNKVHYSENTCLPTDPPFYNDQRQQGTDTFIGTEIFFGIAAAMFIVFLYSTRRAVARYADQRQINTQEQHNDHDLTEEEKHNRRLKILTSIITKVR